MSKFPLLRAPSLVLAKILQLAGPQEIVNLSLCSKRCLKLLTLTRVPTPTDWHLMLLYGFRPAAIAFYPVSHDYVDLLIVKNASELKPEDTPEYLIMNGHQVAVIYEDQCLTTFWEDEILGMKTVINHVSSLFRTDVASLAFNRKGFWTLDWVNNRQESSLKCGAVVDFRDRWTVAELDHIFRNLRPTESLTMTPRTPRDFRFNGNLPVCDEVHLLGNWITINHILAMDAIEIRAQRTKITSWNLNQFLMYWLSGGSRRLEYIHIQIRQTVNPREVFGNGVWDYARPVVQERVYQRGAFGTIQHFRGGVDLHRGDGIIATINISPNHFYMAVWTRNNA